MLSLEVSNVFQFWIAALGSVLFLLALIIAAFWVERRREHRQETGGLEDIIRPEEGRKAA
jgi:hypothetical protein